MSRQIKWWLQNGPIKKNGVLPITNLFFENFVSVRTSFKELICCTNNPNTHICTFCKRWSFIWRAFSLWVSLRTTILYKTDERLLLKTMFIWIQLNNFPNSNLMMSSEIHRTGNDICSENTKFLWRSNFLFSGWRLFSFHNFMKTSPNLTKTILRGAWPWHSRSKICKITGKSGLKFFT